MSMDRALASMLAKAEVTRRFTVVNHLHQAEADAKAWRTTNPNLAALRQRDAGYLRAEVESWGPAMRGIPANVP